MNNKSLARGMMRVSMLVSLLLSSLGVIGCSESEGTPANPPEPNTQIESVDTSISNPLQQEDPLSTKAGSTPSNSYWPQWRGPRGTGVAPNADPPVEWSETKNIRWKIGLPGHGHSTPIVWGDHVFVTAAISVGDAVTPAPDTAPGAHDNSPVTHRRQFVALAIRRSDGEIVWQRTLHEELPHERTHNTGSLASASPVTDGEHLFAFFGSRGLFCLDLDGSLIWQADLGKMQSKHAHGEGASPALYGDMLIVNWDHEGASFVVAFDKSTGERRWTVDRDEVTSWATPIIVVHDGSPQVIVSGSKRLRAYDLATGAIIWECGGLSNNVVASPVSSDGMVYAGSSYEKQTMLAIRLEGAQGDLGMTENLVWMRRRGTPYVPSPLLYDEALYFLHHYQGQLSRVIAKTGEEPLRPQRLSGIRNVYASPVGAAGRIYITDLDGATLVLRHDARPEVLALNQLDDSFSASAALVDGELYLRGESFLYCVVEE
ncbi:MAG: PQQ-binding-like beta-propeller repeat protein [Planctomycetota bacterium]|nr:PQQ-binding-like beta-propeller repeat protein [Planctomycetota bacterium]